MRLFTVYLLALFCSIPTFAAQSWPLCSSGERASDFKTVNTMTRAVLNLDVQRRSLVEVKPEDPRRAQYWLLNRGGTTYLRLDGHAQLEGQAEACQIDGQTVELYGCGPIFGFNQCIRAQIRRIGSGTFFLSFDGHADWNRQYLEHSLAPIERD